MIQNKTFYDSLTNFNICYRTSVFQNWLMILKIEDSDLLLYEINQTIIDYPWFENNYQTGNSEYFMFNNPLHLLYFLKDLSLQTKYFPLSIDIIENYHLHNFNLRLILYKIG